MTTLTLVFSEIRFRLLNFLLSLLAIATAGTLFVTGPMLIAGYAADSKDQLAQSQAEVDKMEAETKAMLADMDKQTKRIMRDLGVNLRIVHEKTDMTNLYADFVAYDFPEEYVERLAKSDQIEAIVHLVATLQHRMKWNDHTVLLVGTLPVLTQSQKNEEKPHMVKNVEPGTVFLGSLIGIGQKAGDEIEIEGHKFTIAKILPEFGGLEDIQMVVHLHDAQKVLDKKGQINQIMALNCKCKGDRLSVIRRELEGVLPDTKVTEHTTRATAREKQRDVVAKNREKQTALLLAHRDRQANERNRQENMLRMLFNVTTPLVVLVCALFVGVMSWLNVRERRAEIGLLRALGKGTANIASLFLMKAALMGLIGGLLGCVIGNLAATTIGGQMDISREFFQTNSLLLAATFLGAPLIAAMASYLPTLVAVAQDPAVVLMDH